MKKKVLSILLLVCMLVSLMPAGAAAYAEELPTVEGAEASPAPADPAPTQAPEQSGSPANDTPDDEPEGGEKEELNEGFFAGLSDAEIGAYIEKICKAGYDANGADRAELYSFVTDTLGLGSLEEFDAWLKLELDAEACIGEKKYASLADAINAVTNAQNTTIMLLKDVEAEGVFVPAGKNIVFELNGHTITLTGETAQCFAIADEYSRDEETGEELHSYSNVAIKNGAIVSRGADAAETAILNTGCLSLENVSVTGRISHSGAEQACRLDIISGVFGGAITAELPETVSVSGGRFAQDVSAWCTGTKRSIALGGGVYTVVDKAHYVDSTGRTVYVEEILKDAQSVMDDDSAVPGAYISVSGLSAAFDETRISELLQRCADAGAFGGAAVLASAGTADDTQAENGVADIELFARATVKETGDNLISYEIKPYASVNGSEPVPVPNEWLNGKSIAVSIYTGFEPQEIEHIHDDMTVDTYYADAALGNTFTYDEAAGTATVNISSFSVVKANAKYAAAIGVHLYETLQDAVNALGTKDTLGVEISGKIRLLSNVSLTESITIPAQNPVEIDLQFHNITMIEAKPLFVIEDKAELTITGKGTVSSKGVLARFEGAGNGMLALGDDSILLVGTYEGEAPVFERADGGEVTGGRAKNVSIKVSKTNFDPTAYVDLTTYEVIDNGDGTWNVNKREFEAQNLTRLDKKMYATVEGAIFDADEGDSILLLKDIHEKDLVIDKSLTIESNGKTVSGNIDVKAPAETVEIRSLLPVTKMTVEGTITAGSGTTLTIVGVEAEKLVVESGAKVTLGNSLTDLTYTNKINGIDNAGEVEIYSGSYNNLVLLEGGKYSLYGGDYDKDYSAYCGRIIVSDTKIFQYKCTQRASDGRWVVTKFSPVIISPTEAKSIQKGSNTTLTFISDAPYETEDGGIEFLAVSVDRSMSTNLSSQNDTPLPAGSFSVGDDGQGHTMVTLNGSYLSTLNAGTYYVRIYSKTGMAYRFQSDNTLACFKVTLRSTTIPGRSNGIIRTGDDADLGLLIGIMALSAITAAGAVTVLKKKKQK